MIQDPGAETIPLSPLVSGAIEAIYRAALDPDLWPTALEKISQSLNSEGSVILIERDDGRTGTIVSPSMQAAAQAYAETWWRHDIRFQRAAVERFLVREVYVDQDFISDAEMESHPFYSGFLVPHGLGWVAATAITPDPRTLVVLTIQRARAKGPFAKHELPLVSAFGRHCELSLTLSTRLMEGDAVGLSLADALGKVGTGVFLLDAQGRVTFANDAANLLVGRGFSMAHGRLMAERVADRGRFDTALRNALEGQFDLCPVILRADESAPLAAHIRPLIRPGSKFEPILSASSVLVLVQGGGGAEMVDAGLAKSMFGLTTGEARLAVLIAAGQTPRDAASTLGIAEGTARVVLKRVFEKVGVARQSELVARFARLASSSSSASERHH